jgi:hypothetical protein
MFSASARRRRIWRAPVLAVTFLGCAVMLRRHTGGRIDHLGHGGHRQQPGAVRADLLT